MTETLPSIEQIAARVAELLRDAEVVEPFAIPNPAGHVVVAPGQTIGSDWGNAVWNQSVQRFASIADRDAQFTAPVDGAVCYTIAESAHWRRQGGRWLTIGTAMLAFATNGVQGQVGTGETVFLQTDITLASPRKLRVTSFVAGTETVGGTYMTFRLLVSAVQAGQPSSQPVIAVPNPGLSDRAGSTTLLTDCPAGPVRIQMLGQSAGGIFRVDPGNARMWTEDIGGVGPQAVTQ